MNIVDMLSNMNTNIPSKGDEILRKISFKSEQAKIEKQADEFIQNLLCFLKCEIESISHGPFSEAEVKILNNKMKEVLDKLPGKIAECKKDFFDCCDEKEEEHKETEEHKEEPKETEAKEFEVKIGAPAPAPMTHFGY